MDDIFATLSPEKVRAIQEYIAHAEQMAYLDGFDDGYYDGHEDARESLA